MEGWEWELTTIYASPNSSVRRFLREKVDGVDVQGPWMILGDFNCTLLGEERCSGVGTSSGFRDWMDGRGLLDLGYIGSRYTKNYGTKVETRRAARLDRALCCDIWRRMFPDATVRHLSHSHSAHCPILLELT